MATYVSNYWKEVVAAWEREYRILSGMSPQRTALVTSPSAATTAAGIGPSGKCSSLSGTQGYTKSGFGFFEESGKTAMSDDKSIELKLGGRFGFKVTKTFHENAERFSVELDGGYNRGVMVADNATWVEASAAMNKFKDEFETAFEALVQVSTLTPVGVHEEE